MDFKAEDEFDDAAGAGDAWENNEVVGNGEVPETTSQDTYTTQGYSGAYIIISPLPDEHLQPCSL